MASKEQKPVSMLSQIHLLEEVVQFLAFIDEIQSEGENSRELALAKTKVEEAYHWLQAIKVAE